MINIDMLNWHQKSNTNLTLRMVKRPVEKPPENIQKEVLENWVVWPTSNGLLGDKNIGLDWDHFMISDIPETTPTSSETKFAWSLILPLCKRIPKWLCPKIRYPQKTSRVSPPCYPEMVILVRASCTFSTRPIVPRFQTHQALAAAHKTRIASWEECKLRIGGLDENAWPQICWDGSVWNRRGASTKRQLDLKVGTKDWLPPVQW